MTKKIFLHILCGNNRLELDQLTKDTYELFDGIIGLNDISSTDGSYELLNDRKGQGKIYRHPWLDDFSLSRNICLMTAYKEGFLQEKNIIFPLDCEERVNPQFIKELKNSLLDELESQGIRTVYQGSKPAFFRWYSSVRYIAGVHTALVGVYPKLVDLSQMERFKDRTAWIYSKRDGIKSWVAGSKYYFFGLSNECQLVYEPQRFPSHPRKDELANEHEHVRQKFLYYMRYYIGIDPSFQNMIKFMLDNNKWPNDFVEFVEYEKILKTFYRYYVLQQNYLEIYNSEEAWSIKEYLNTIKNGHSIS